MGPEDNMSAMTDNEVIELARKTRTELDSSTRYTPARATLLARMGVLYAELNRRGISDTVTEGHRRRINGLFLE